MARISDPSRKLQSITWYHLELNPVLGESVFKSSPRGEDYVILDTAVIMRNLPAQPLVIMVTVTTRNGAASAMKSVSVKVPGAIGNFSITPAVGFALSTTFTAQLGNWSNQGGNMLKYDISYAMSSEAQAYLVLPTLTFNTTSGATANFTLPFIGDLSTDQNITVFARVIDEFHVTREAKFQLTVLTSVTVTNLQDKPELLYDLLQKSARDLASWPGISQYIATLSTIHMFMPAKGETYHLCVSDADCYGHGVCVLDTEFGRCACFDQFASPNCRWSPGFAAAAQSYSERAVSWILTTVKSSETAPTAASSLRYLPQLVAGITEPWDLFTNKSLNESLQILEYVRRGV
jgi:hypothetical protein